MDFGTFGTALDVGIYCVLLDSSTSAKSTGLTINFRMCVFRLLLSCVPRGCSERNRLGVSVSLLLGLFFKISRKMFKDVACRTKHFSNTFQFVVVHFVAALQ